MAAFLFTIGLLIGLSMQAAHPFPDRSLTYSFAVVDIRNSTLVPDNVAIYKNATVVWVNRDQADHDLIVGSAGTSLLHPGDSFTVNFREFGKYDSYCADNRSSFCTVIVR